MKQLPHHRRGSTLATKALFSQNDTNPSTDKGNLLEAQRQAILQAQVQLLNYALNQSYSVERWKNVVNVMIGKEPGNSNIH
jgi:hypothetical protein